MWARFFTARRRNKSESTKKARPIPPSNKPPTNQTAASKSDAPTNRASNIARRIGETGSNSRTHIHLVSA